MTTDKPNHVEAEALRRMHRSGTLMFSYGRWTEPSESHGGPPSWHASIQTVDNLHRRGWCEDHKGLGRGGIMRPRRITSAGKAALALASVPAVGDERVYDPSEYVITRNRGVPCRVVAVNRHGHITVEFLGGVCKGQRRGVKVHEIREAA